MRRRAETIPTPEEVEIFIAGAVHTLASRTARAAAGIFIEGGNPSCKGKCIPVTGEQSQYAAELFTALEATKMTHRDTILTITSTQTHVMEAMNKKLPGWELEGWVGVKHRDVLRCLAAELKARRARTTFKTAVPASPEKARCLKASILAKQSARNRVEERWDLTLPPNTALPGMRLQGNRQRVFYRSIREIKDRNLTPRPSTLKMLDVVRKDVEFAFGRYVTDADIWLALTARDLLPRTAQFLWKGLHKAHRIGNYWNHIPECGDRAICQECGVLEDLEHILIRCTSPGQSIIWQATETLWREKEEEWPLVSLGTVLGCCLAEFRDEKGKAKQGTQRLYRILMSESAYLIWKLRNERVISRDGTPATDEEIKNRWKYHINQRLQVDMTLARRPRLGKRPALAPLLVLTTWSRILDNEQSLPADWLREARVLVGSRAFPQARPRRHRSQGIG
ncbi:hypothetical protein DFH07DRAFT_752023 [Mycena maculata]|uniref:Reverse transcriptase zinc-binding domain-containing protein n=1 Tax=Mycena maculata TaxID=230809 RepID=A0AAD7ICN3_9AGAR|nr:hypothetical protein DFH07DRAFT_752023 [Mycena maculata]